MRFLSRTHALNPLFPVAQNFLHVSSNALQCLNVCFDTLELVLGKLVHTTAWSTPGVTSFQSFSQLGQSEADPERPLHDKNSLQRARRIDSVTRLCSRGSWQNRSFHNVESCLDSLPPTWPRPRSEELWNRRFAPYAVSTLECIPESRCFFTRLWSGTIQGVIAEESLELYQSITGS